MIRIVFLLFISLPLLGQDQVSFSVGYAGYGMSSLRKFQNGLENQFVLKPKNVNSFPSFWSFEGAYTHFYKSNYFIGGQLWYGSTGGRLSYSDYSGEQLSDQKIGNISVGFNFGKLFKLEKSFEFQLGVKPFLSFSSLNLIFENRLGNSVDNESFSFRSLNFSLEPNLTLVKHIGSIGIQVTSGYNVAVSNGKLYLNDSQDAFLLNQENEEVTADWSGFRLAFGVGYRFSNQGD